MARIERPDFICNIGSISCGTNANEVNYLAVSSQRVQRTERRLTICKPSKEYVGLNCRIPCHSKIHQEAVTTRLRGYGATLLKS